LPDAEVRRLSALRGFVTEDELKRCEAILGNLRRRTPDTTLAQVLIDYQYITKSQLRRLKGEPAATSLPADNGQGGSAVPQQIPGYQVISKLGAGAMAVVYKAKQIALDRTVAIKILPKRMSASAEFAKLNHPNIVGAVDVGQEPGGFHYFVMEFVEGETVFDEMEKRGAYDEAEALRITIDVAKALEHAHAKGFIHRDVKPKNIMVTPERIAKLADMGLARHTEDAEAAQQEKGRAYGTPYYIAPEQIKGEVDIDARADIYSLGATLYHMVTGRVPFDGATPTEVMRKHLKEKLVPPDHIIRTLSTGVSEVVEKMMAKKKADRYSSAKELLIDLEAVSKGEAPPIARANIDPERAIGGLDDIAGGEANPGGSVHAVRAELTQKLAEATNRFLMACGVAFFFFAAEVITIVLYIKKGS
jgi:serine/threonine-protein kinase